MARTSEEGSTETRATFWLSEMKNSSRKSSFGSFSKTVLALSIAIVLQCKTTASQMNMTVGVAVPVEGRMSWYKRTSVQRRLCNIGWYGLRSSTDFVKLKSSSKI